MYDSFTLDGEGPLYAQITRAIAHDIVSGRLKPGDRLPSEERFTTLFQASRMTVNRALRRLADDGMVTRKRRGGTFVATRIRDHAVLDIRDIQEDITLSGSAYGYELLSAEAVAANATIADALSIKPNDPVIRVQCRHLSDDDPILMEDRHINVAAVPDLDITVFGRTPPNSWLIGHVPWSRATLGVTAVAADQYLSKHLNVTAGAPCLQVERTTWHIDQAVTCVCFTYPGDKHRLNAQFSPTHI